MNFANIYYEKFRHENAAKYLQRININIYEISLLSLNNPSG